MLLTIGLGKGGSAKSLTALYLAIGLNRRDGRPVLLVDADPANATATDWADNSADWPTAVRVEPWASPALEKRIGAAVEADPGLSVVVDTGPAHPEILRAALKATGELLVPIGPSPVELRQIGVTISEAAAVDEIRPIRVRALLTKMRANTISSREAREYLEGLEVPVLAATVALREAYPASWGTVPADLGEYDDVLTELLADLEPARAQA
jgi:chromosome partitioning protein